VRKLLDQTVSVLQDSRGPHAYVGPTGKETRPTPLRYKRTTFSFMSLIGEPIQESDGKPFIAQDLHPITEGQIGCADEASCFHRRGAELEEGQRTGLGERHIAEFIGNDRLAAQALLQESG
jgi:hypothetical protein